MRNAVRTERIASSRLLSLGVVVVCCLCIALLEGLVLQMKTARRTDVRRERQACNTIRDTIRAWAYALAVRANSIGTGITVQEGSLPFLILDAKTFNAIKVDMQIYR